MTARIVYKGKMDKQIDYEFFDLFIKFLQQKYPLKNDITINFLAHRVGHMSTGSRNSQDELNILFNGRLNRDILRTLAHEWVHEHQRTVLKRKQGPDIGGKNENEANAISGILIKQFEKKYPELEEEMYS